MTTTAPSSPPDQAALIDLGQRFLNAMLDSADPDALGRDYWTRARTALEASAATASFPEMTAKCAAKLEITGALAEGGHARTVTVIGELGSLLSDPVAFGALAEECRNNAVYITAVARIRRDERKAAARAARPASNTLTSEPEY
jgi:hypothetical protein